MSIERKFYLYILIWKFLPVSCSLKKWNSPKMVLPDFTKDWRGNTMDEAEPPELEY